MVVSTNLFLELCCIDPNTEDAKIALNFRNALAKYGSIKPNLIDPRKSHQKLGVIIPQDSMDIIDFTIIFLSYYDCDLSEHDIVRVFENHNQNDSCIKDWVRKIIDVITKKDTTQL